MKQKKIFTLKDISLVLKLIAEKKAITTDQDELQALKQLEEKILSAEVL